MVANFNHSTKAQKIVSENIMFLAVWNNYIKSRPLHSFAQNPVVKIPHTGDTESLGRADSSTNTKWLKMVEQVVRKGGGGKGR